jgi:hypothetical protein
VLPPPPLTVNEQDNDTVNTTDGMNCTNQSDGNGTACALVTSSSFSKWTWILLLLLMLLLLCCLVLLLTWLCGCFEKRGKKNKRGKKRRGDVEQQDSFIADNAIDRNLAPSMPSREISMGARSTDPLMLNQEPSAGEGSAFGLIDRNQDGVITRSELQYAQQMMGTQQLTQVITGAAPASYVSYPTGGVQQQLVLPAVTAPPVRMVSQGQPVRMVSQSTMPGVTSMAGQTVMPQSFQPAVRTVQGGYPVQSTTTITGNVMPAGAHTIR